MGSWWGGVVLRSRLTQDEKREDGEGALFPASGSVRALLWCGRALSEVSGKGAHDVVSKPRGPGLCATVGMSRALLEFVFLSAKCHPDRLAVRTT